MPRNVSWQCVPLWCYATQSVTVFAASSRTFHAEVTHRLRKLWSKWAALARIDTWWHYLFAHYLSTVHPLFTHYGARLPLPSALSRNLPTFSRIREFSGTLFSHALARMAAYNIYRCSFPPSFTFRLFFDNARTRCGIQETMLLQNRHFFT